MECVRTSRSLCHCPDRWAAATRTDQILDLSDHCAPTSRIPGSAARYAPTSQTLDFAAHYAPTSLIRVPCARCAHPALTNRWLGVLYGRTAPNSPV